VWNACCVAWQMIFMIFLIYSGNSDVAPWIWHWPRTLKLRAFSLDFSVPGWVVCYVGKWSPVKYIHMYLEILPQWWIINFVGFCKIENENTVVCLISRIGDPDLFSVQNSNCFSFFLLKNSGVLGSVHFWCWWHVCAWNYTRTHMHKSTEWVPVLISNVMACR